MNNYFDVLTISQTYTMFHNLMVWYILDLQENQIQVSLLNLFTSKSAIFAMQLKKQYNNIRLLINILTMLAFI